MKQSLQMRMGQQLTMTPQLQQAIKLLQLSTLDLQQEIQQALESNMMLEVDEEAEAISQHSLEPQLENFTLNQEADAPDLASSSEVEMSGELDFDSSWENAYDEALLPVGAAYAEEFDFEIQHSKAETLQEHLLWQLGLTPTSDKDQAIAIAIIDAINEKGYLSTTLDDIYAGLSAQMEDLDFDEVQAVLHKVQSFEPAGVAAIDLADCLALQLLQLPDSIPYKDSAIKLVKQHLKLLADHEQEKLMKLLEVSEAQLGQIISLIRRLDPAPGTKLQHVDFQYVIPDVFVVKRGGVWQVHLNPEIAPKLRINPFYAGLIKRADNSQDNSSMKSHLQEAKWFIKSLHGRNDTLLRVAQCIVEKQGDFLEYGAIAMKPMVLRDVAEELELHESTISRVTTQKYMHTPNGIVEFKHFFSSHVSTAEGGECSATAIRAFIKELIANELPTKPLSDDKISKLLQEKGINVARRTIAKYREAMFIAASNERKRLL
jgi:RNA polymerase sigma-54 factor